MRLLFGLLSSLSLINLAASISSPSPKYHTLPSLREQAKIQDAWTKERTDTIPSILAKYGVDAWLISQREYSEDTVFWSLKSATQFSARRRTLYLFLSDSLTTSPSKYSYTWIDNTPSLWSSLLSILNSSNPSSIAFNLDADIAFAGGMHAGEFGLIGGMIGEKWTVERKVTEPMIAVEFIAKRVVGQLEWYKKMMETAWAIVSEGFSERVVKVGETSAEDLSWWFREQYQFYNYSTWFMPTVSIITPSSSDPGPAPPSSQAIQHGDLLHVDFGLTALGLNTDTQHLGYVLYPGESSVPEGFKEGLRKGNRMQDIVLELMEPGLTGNQVLKMGLEVMEREGIKGKIYCHPIGDWGHSAGSLIGMTNLQESVPVLGDLPILSNTYYSIELYAEHFVEERNATYLFMLEEDVYWDEELRGWTWVYGRQEEFHLVYADGDGDGDGVNRGQEKEQNVDVKEALVVQG